MSAPLDCVVIGAGPAGCSAASWLAQLGLATAVVDAAATPCASLAGLDFEQDWVLGHPRETLAVVGERLGGHALSLPTLLWHLDRRVTGLRRIEDGSPTGCWHVRFEGDGAVPSPTRGPTMLSARSLVLATGVRPVRPALYLDVPGADRPVLDALSLTACRATLPPGRVLLLGGGDNALENATYLASRGHAVTLWTRGDWRGQAALIAALDAHAGIAQRRQVPLPTALRPRAGGGYEVQSEAFGLEGFDTVAVLFGDEPEPAPWSWLEAALRGAGPPRPLRPGRPIEALGVFVAGDASGRWHPCVQTALADGVTAAQQVAAWLHPAGAGRPAFAPKPPPATLNSHVLQLTGLRFGANLGVLDHERVAPQPIQVDAELNLGEQPALPRDADIGHVLDYRKVRQIIIDECTAEHTDLLESLLAKLCVRLMRLPGVLGVRIRVAKLEIFDDCEVAIRCEAGLW
ncbi:MAG: dihydroneopterin aldolase [Burkholderiales bacterium]|nr:dihydroneopterin aldolase [Burkholderiales bacterium]